MPGTLFPVDRPRVTSSRAELTVYDALARQLPDGWCAWHSLRLREPRGPWEGEGDFVIAVPELGILVLEVKGGQIELSGGHWLQNGREMKKPPRDQAQGFARGLVRALGRKGLRVPFGIVCAFPDAEFSAGPSTGDLQDVVIGGRQLQYLSESLPALAKKLIVKDRGFNFPAVRAALHGLWGETWVPRVVLRDRVEDSARQRIALDAEQLQTLDMAGENPRALVVGAAGTGKTVVARELCLRRAAEGQRVLYLCFTEALAQAIEHQFRDSPYPPERLRSVAVRQYARELVGAETPPPSSDALEFWEKISTRALERLPPAEARTDCVVVDEAQDLAEADWGFVEALVGDRGLWIFHDPRQAFWRERGIPESFRARGLNLRLMTQRRCPEAVAQLAERFAGETGGPAISMDRSALQLVVGAESELLPRLAATLDGLIREGARPEEIAVLSLGGQKRSVLQQLDAVGSHALVRSDSPEASGAVVADTFLRFKGLERPFVILAELDGGWDHKFDTRMHIALTRATVGVRILCTREDLDREPRLATLVSAREHGHDGNAP